MKKKKKMDKIKKEKVSPNIKPLLYHSLNVL